MLSDVAVNDKDFRGLLELRVTELEEFHGILIVTDLFDLGPAEIYFRELNSLLLWRCDAKLIHLNETFDEVCHEWQIILANLHLDVGP